MFGIEAKSSAQAPLKTFRLSVRVLKYRFYAKMTAGKNKPLVIADYTHHTFLLEDNATFEDLDYISRFS